MGKYAATRTMNNDRKRTVNSDSDTWHGTIEYLTEVPDDRSQFMLQNFLYNSDPTGFYQAYINNRDTMNYWDDYFRNTGLDWSDIKYPSMMRNFGSMTYGSSAKNAMYIISKNASKLFKK